MNKLFKISLFVFAFTFLACSSFLSFVWAEIILNPSFETAGAGGATTSDQWTVFTAGAQIAERRDDGTDAGDTDMWFGVAPAPGAPFGTAGSHALQINLFGGGAAGVFQNIFGPSEGDVVTITADARTPNLAGAGDGRAEVRVEFFNQAATQLSSTLSTAITTVNTGAAFATFTTSARAPANTSFARITLATVDLGGAGDVAFDNIRAEITKFTGKLSGAQQFPVSVSGGNFQNVEAFKGKLITVSARIQNTTAVAIPALEVRLTVPFGLDLVRNTVLVDNQIIVPSRIGGNYIIPFVGALAAGEIRNLTFQILVSSGVTVGQVYDVVMFARNPLTGLAVSATTVIPVRIIADTLFDAGTLIGKVFDDKNENGVQDQGENGIPNVRLATEDGIVVYTDKDGKYNIPGLEPNRHIIKIDGHSLPKGTCFITEEKFLFKTTPGMLSKVSFAVKLPEGQVPEAYREDLDVYVSQYYDDVEPVIKAWMSPLDLRLGQGVFEANPVFHFDTNYGNFIADWRVEVRNEYGEAVWTGYGEGEPPSEVPWNGIGDNEKIIEPGDYSYRLIVADKDAHEDWTPLQYFRVESKLADGSGQREDQPFTDTGHFNIQKDGKRSIPLNRHGVAMVRGKVKEGRGLALNGRKVTANADGSFKEFVYLPYGKNSVNVSSTDVEGQSINYTKEVELKDRYFFMVGIGEGELGYNQIKGSYETLGEDDEFEDHFYEKGRVAFYVKGKIKGSFLVTAHADTDDREPDRNLSRLFTNLDPDAFYPVYGDESTIDYEAQDSQERFYILIESDRSFFKYGSIHTDFDETELASYNRTLSGAKGHFETLSTTKYGDPKAGFTVLSAIQRQSPDHNEFVATGGSVYYLRNRLVIEGSEKVRVEIRDKIQNMVVSQRDLVEGEDYEIDYQAGRILMSRPLTSVNFSDSIIANDILDGSKVILVVDYEFESRSIFDFNSRGIRGWTHMSDHAKLGGTWVRQTGLSTVDDYIVRGLDGTFRFGENTRIIAEVAETSNSQSKAALSFDGGLSFIDNQTGGRARSEAYSIKAEHKIGKRTEISGYYRVLTPGFAVVDIASQQGTRKYGVNVRYKITDHLHARFRHDHEELVAPRISVVPQVFFDPERARTTSLQALYARGKWDIIAEYRYQDIDVDSAFRVVENILDNERFENALGIKIGYQALDWVKPFVRGQVAQGGDDNNQIGFGAEVRLPDNKTTARIEEIVGNIGDATLIGVEREVDDRTRVYSNMGVARRTGQSKQSLLTTLGTSHVLDDHSRVYTERRYSSDRFTDINQQNILGYDTQLADRWNMNATFERSAIDELSRPDKRNVGSLTLAYNDQKRIQSAVKGELRYDVGTTKTRQLLFQNTSQIKLTDDITLKSRLNTSKTRNMSQEATLAYFTEFNVGLAYRPIHYDRFNFLSRYTYLTGKEPDIAFQGGVPIDQRSHTIAVEGAYDLTRHFQLVEKFAVRNAKFSLNSGQDSTVDIYLWAHRLNFHVTRKWDLSGEYRIHFQENAADDQRHGFLLEVDRQMVDYVRLGVGYDFSHFNDGITPESGFEFHGFFVRLTGEF